uniref:Uncharacterized protein n=1 Tax=Vespula pensylvanica TaxID=30213 RepID=A0A834JZ77_VESPE|nr:hypothetical protein H0235_016402 [Vespula pensylvanica]
MRKRTSQTNWLSEDREAAKGSPDTIVVPTATATTRNIVGREHIGTFRIAHVASTSSLASVRYCAPVGKVCVLSSITNAKVRSQPSPTGQMPREALLPISGHSVTISS